MSADILQPTGSLTDPYLARVAQLLQTYWNGVHEKQLVLQRNPPQLVEIHQTIQITVPVGVQIKFQVVPDGGSNRIRRTSGTANQIESPEQSLYVTELVSVYNHKLQHVVELELQAIKELKSRQGTLPRKITKLTLLKKSLEEFTQVIDKIMSFYSAGAVGFHSENMPTLEDLKTVEEKVASIQDFLKFEELAPLIKRHNKKCLYTDENILCTILGLKDEFGQLLFEMDDELKMHQSVLHYLENIIENEENHMKSESMFQESGLGGMNKKLRRLGFTKERAETITASIPEDLLDLQLASYWAMRYLEFAFMHHPLLTNVPRYPYQIDVTDEWFDEQVPVGNRPEPETSQAYMRPSWPVKMMNVSSPDGHGNTLVEEFLRQEQNDREYQLLYHGTTHGSAKSILEDGILLTMGSKGQDFSSADGFYLSFELESAQKWMRATIGEKCQSVIVFKVKRDLLDAENEGGLDLSEDESKWGQIIRLCRNRYKCKSSNQRTLMKLLKDATFIVGPRCHNPMAAYTHGPLAGFHGNGRKMQFCVRDDDYALKVGSIENISCVLFYNLP